MLFPVQTAVEETWNEQGVQHAVTIIFINVYHLNATLKSRAIML